jgi:hypothetical protein
MLSPLDQQYLQARLAQAEVLLADAEQDDDPLGQHQLRQLVRDLRGQFAALPPSRVHAPVDIV